MIADLLLLLLFCTSSNIMIVACLLHTGRLVSKNNKPAGKRRIEEAGSPPSRHIYSKQHSWRSGTG
jgi:hypothetical protein